MGVIEFQPLGELQRPLQALHGLGRGAHDKVTPHPQAHLLSPPDSLLVLLDGIPLLERDSS